MSKSIIQGVIEAVQTYPGTFTTQELSKDVADLIPHSKGKNLSSTLSKLKKENLIISMGRAKYKVKQGANFSKVKTARAYAQRTKFKPKVEEKQLTSSEIGSAMIEYVNQLKASIIGFTEEIEKLNSRLKRTDQITIDMVREAKLERNTHYKDLIKDKDSIIKRLNSKIELMNTKGSLDRKLTFPLGELTSFKQ